MFDQEELPVLENKSFGKQSTKSILYKIIFKKKT